jgi:hypothetical protein
MYYGNGTPVILAGGSVPAGFTAGTTYYVVSTSIGAGTFELAATSGGTAVNSTSTGSGTVKSASYSRIYNATLNIGVECNGTTGTQPGTINFGNSAILSTCIEQCTGIIDFTGNNAFAVNGTSWTANFLFDGPVYGDGNLKAAPPLGRGNYGQGVITNGATINTRYNAVATVAPAGNVTGVGLSRDFTVNWRDITIVNESAFTVTMAAAGTSFVADGTSDVIPALSSARYSWDVNTGLWYRTAGTVTSVTAGDTSIVAGGTSTAPTIETATIDVIAADHPPAADWSNNSHKITSLANGGAASDAMALGQSFATSGGSPSGCIAQTVPWWFTNGSGIAATSGTLYLHAVTLAAGKPVSNLTFAVGSTGGLTLTHGWYALLNSALLQVAHTADQTSGNLASATAVTKGLVTPYTPAVTALYYIGYVIVASTQPTFCGTSNTEGGSFFTIFPSSGASSTGLTTPGTDGTTSYAAITAAGSPVYGYCS